MVQLFLVPFFTLIITVPITFLVIGPVASWASDALSALFYWYKKVIASNGQDLSD